MAHIVEATKGKIRDQPIAPELAKVLMGAAEAAGIDTVLVTSGGQPGSSGRSTGSTRHNHGRAADLELQIGGRSLNFTDSGDRPTVEEFVAAAAAYGAIGIGAGVDYMGPRTLHVGFGTSPQDHTKVVWGAQGKSVNAPTWLRQAASKGWNNPGLYLGKKQHLESVPEPSETHSTEVGQDGQVDNVLQLLLRSMLSGKQLEIGELLAILLTGKPIPTPTPSPLSPPSPPQSPADINTLLLQVVYERLTGQPWPGTTPAEPPKKPDNPEVVTQPATSRPSVQLSAGALAISTLLQALGVVGTPFEMGPNPTTTGTLATLIPILTGVVGATGGLGTLLNGGRSLLGGFGGAAKSR